MCQAVQEMCDDARAEGRTQGFTEGEITFLELCKQNQGIATKQSPEIFHMKL